MCLLWSTNWVFISQKTTFFIVTAVKTSNLTLSTVKFLCNGSPMFPIKLWWYPIQGYAHVILGWGTVAMKMNASVITGKYCIHEASKTYREFRILWIVRMLCCLVEGALWRIQYYWRFHHTSPHCAQDTTNTNANLFATDPRISRNFP
jgi:hypothetical protein